jgi:hypothetical protein
MSRQAQEIYEVERRFPYEMFYWFLIGAGLAALAYYAPVLLDGTYMVHPAIRGTQARWIAAVAAAIVAGYKAPTLFDWAFGPKTFELSEEAIRYGSRVIPYRDVERVVVSAFDEATMVTARGVGRVRLRWTIWRDAPTWTGLIEQGTAPWMLPPARAAFERGEEQRFGRRVRLSKTTLTVNGRKLPVADIMEMYVQSERDQNVEEAFLHVATTRDSAKIAQQKLWNGHVMLQLIEERLERLAVEPERVRPG